ncbi:hypothetical protein GA0070616_3928 [Micromonospora nigra]|uniref:Uncharacterized protein n=1 Tax=Micromonospora nigra TaxID=145857 RepID=A0A1C6SJJ2_9ACTN|nr:hypothetical protein [Micromonospora nigra]SCL29676.1 hypothetical protein GA0070616_3928 [Micromonospora nigra]
MDDKDRADEQEGHAFADLVPSELDAIPPHASGETKRLYLIATVVQLGQIAVSVWGLNRLSDPELDTSSKVVTGIAMIIALAFCVSAWSEAYHSAADDQYRSGPK